MCEVKLLGKNISIAIDGPNGSGKSTLAKMLASKLGIIYIDTGAMYRAVALYMTRKGIGEEDEAGIKDKLETLDISIRHVDGAQKVLIFDEDVTNELRTREVSELASKFAVNPNVRERLVSLQRKIAASESVVMDGRDIGAFVLPDATLKIYLDAGIDVRTARRAKEYVKAGAAQEEINAIREEIIRRDERDINREHSPLTKAADAILIDSSGMNEDEVAAFVQGLLENKLQTKLEE